MKQIVVKVFDQRNMVYHKKDLGTLVLPFLRVKSVYTMLLSYMMHLCGTETMPSACLHANVHSYTDYALTLCINSSLPVYFIPLAGSIWSTV